VTRQASRIAARRARARALADEGLSVREIALRLDVSKSTAAADLLVPEADSDGRPVVPNRAENGNERALTHGVYSDRRIAPVREQHVIDLAERFPGFDGARIALQAQRLAQIDLGSAWLDQRGGVVRSEHGQVFDIADKVLRWAAQAEVWFERAEAERREHGRHDALAEVVAEGREAWRRREQADSEQAT
jgi:hypothetical protein